MAEEGVKRHRCAAPPHDFRRQDGFIHVCKCGKEWEWFESEAEGGAFYFVRGSDGS